MEFTGSSFIAGKASRQGADTYYSVNPRTGMSGDVPFYNATPAEIDQAVNAAAAAFEITRAYPPERLADFLETVIAEIEAMGDAFLQVADSETGLGLPRLTMERGRTFLQMRLFADYIREGSYVEAIIDRAQPDRQPTPRVDVRRMLVPLGVVAVFPSGNFPLSFGVAGNDSASIWAVGCPTVVKAHPGYPMTAEMTAWAINRAVESCGFPPGFFSLLHGSSIEVGQQLVEHPLLEAVGFTGSLRGGRAVFDAAARRLKPIPVFAEMGSVNPVLIMPGALEARKEAIAEGLVTSLTLGTGQYCTNPGLIILPNVADTQEFIDLVVQKMDARTPGVLLGAAGQRGLAQTVAQTLANPGVERRTGGAVIEGEAFCYAHTVMQTTDAAFLEDPDGLQREHFGPVTLMVVCDTPDSLGMVVEALHGSLTATIHAEDREMLSASSYFELLRYKAGRLIWNGYPTGLEIVYSMTHGGPYPATTAPATSAIGHTALRRFLRPVTYQNFPDAMLPEALQNANPRGILRIIDGEYTHAPIE